MSGAHAYTDALVSAPAWRYYVHLRLGPPGLPIRKAHKRVKRTARRTGWRWPEIAAIKTLENRHGLTRSEDDRGRGNWDADPDGPGDWRCVA